MSNPFTPKPPTPPLTRAGTGAADKTPASFLNKPTDSPFSRPAGTGLNTGLGTPGAAATSAGTSPAAGAPVAPPKFGATAPAAPTFGTTAPTAPTAPTFGTTAPSAPTAPGFGTTSSTLPTFGAAKTPPGSAAAPVAGKSLFTTPAGSPLTTPGAAAGGAMPGASNLSAAKIERPAVTPTVASGLVGMKASDEEFRQLRDFIYEHCGIYIADNRKYLIENRLVNRIKELNLKNFSEYYHYLRYDSNRRAELTRLFEVVTTNETSFFRNPPQLEVFQNKVLPTVIEDIRATGRKKLRIWSAGCSTGDEPYTIAIILAEVLKAELASWDIKITASDLSEAVLAAGKRGVYNEYTLRTTPKALVDKYFHKEGTNYRVDDKLKAMIQFGALNLNDRMQIRRIDPSHIIFCRNVIIYFDDVMKKNVISAFYDNLLPGGYLIIGHSESLHNISRAFQPEHHPSAIMYRRG